MPTGLAVLTAVWASAIGRFSIHASEPVGHRYPGKGRFTPEACLRSGARPIPALTIVFAHMGGGLFLYEMMPEVRAALAVSTTTRRLFPTYTVTRSIEVGSRLRRARASSSSAATFPLLSPAQVSGGLDWPRGLSSAAAVVGGNARRVFGL